MHTRLTHARGLCEQSRSAEGSDVGVGIRAEANYACSELSNCLQMPVTFYDASRCKCSMTAMIGIHGMGRGPNKARHGLCASAQQVLCFQE
jgi:hypothetical protein